jgi:hypothetical protein
MKTQYQEDLSGCGWIALAGVAFWVALGVGVGWWWGR